MGELSPCGQTEERKGRAPVGFRSRTLSTARRRRRRPHASSGAAGVRFRARSAQSERRYNNAHEMCNNSRCAKQLFGRTGGIARSDAMPHGATSL